jgi:protocatechuate 3,4-dioxygenase beta subunit
MRNVYPLLLSGLVVVSVVAQTSRVHTTAIADVAESQSTFRFTGRVVTADDQPVEGAVAEFYSVSQPLALMESRKMVTSDANGVVEADLDRVWTIGLLRKSGLAVTWLNLHNTTGDHEERIVMMSPTNLVGMVVDSAGEPVANAEVCISQALVEVVLDGNRRTYRSLFGPPAREAFSTRTSPDGRFEIGSFPPNGMAHFSARAPGKVLRAAFDTARGPDAMFRPGQQNIKLVLEEAGVVEGKVVLGETGAGLPGVQLHLDHQRAWSFPEPVLSGPDGAFRIDAGAGTYTLAATFGTNTPPQWVAARETFSIRPGETTRDIVVKAVRGGLLEVTVLDEEGKPVDGASIHASRENSGGGGITSASGLGSLRLTPGEYQVGASRSFQNADQIAASIEDGATNKITVKFKPRPKIAGTITDRDGKPAAGVKVYIFPNWGGIADSQPTTDAAGKYELIWDPQRHGTSERTFSLIASDAERNLAVAEDIDEETRSLDLQIQPGLSITGRVEDAGNRPLTNATIRVILWTARMGSQFGDQPKTDAEGKFAISGLPAGRRYSLDATAEGYGSVSKQVQEAEEETSVELPVFVLNLADQELAGQVLDEEEKPVSGAYVSIYGDGQPNANVRTDSEGRFAMKVCEGTVRLYTHHQNAYSSTSAQAGDTNVLLQLTSRSSSPMREQARRASLKGRQLPDVGLLGLSRDSSAEPGPLLLCLFDSEQRPSRRILSLLSEKHQELQGKKVAILAAQSVVIAAESMQEWKEDNSFPFAIGSISEKTDAVKWATEVETLPWLILADAEGRVAAEGFQLDEIEEQIELLKKQ